MHEIFSRLAVVFLSRSNEILHTSNIHVAHQLNNDQIALRALWHACQARLREGGNEKEARVCEAMNLANQDDATASIINAFETSSNVLVRSSCDLIFGELGNLLGEAQSVNFMRIYNVIPLPTHNNHDDTEVVSKITSLGKRATTEEGQDGARLVHLRGALMTQKELFHFYKDTKRKAQLPATYDFDREAWVKRDHWAEHTATWNRLTGEERQKAYETDCSVLEAPIDWGE